MYIFFEKLLNQKQCDELNQAALRMMMENKLSHEVDNSHYGNSYGTARIPAYEKLLHDLTPRIREATGINNITEENSYTRIYYDGSKLKKHKDRVGLDITLTACTFTNINKPWPLYVETTDGLKAFETKVGDGALILGTTMDHWRDDLKCEKHQMVIQSFYHWRIINAS